MNFKDQLSQKQQAVNEILDQLLKKRTEIQADLKESLEYILSGRGKRIRAALVLWCCEIVAGQVNRDALTAAAAIEMVHAYSLVHDDLPAMDDDDFRRGRPTCHKAFDEATAILAGDGLLTLAFEVLATEISQPTLAIKLIGQLAESAGPAGMIAGQMADLKAEKQQSSSELLKYIHINKTAKMFQCSAICGGLAGGADSDQLKCLSEYGLKIGLGFQIADDILDVSASSKQLGKTAGKDVKAGKLTYPAIFGLERSKALEKQLADEAIAATEQFGQKADILRQLALSLLERTK